MTRSYDIGGIPSDLLSSDVEFERRFKVESKLILEAGNPIELLFLELIFNLKQQNQEVIAQLELLNARTEDTFKTKITKKDLRNGRI